MAELLRQFVLDEAKRQVLAECSYGVGGLEAEWPNNMLSTRSVVYGNGAIARRGEPLVFATDPDEMSLCERLSAEAKSVAGEMEVGMGSEAGDPFHPFFIAADEAVDVPEKISQALIRARFGGTIFPQAIITVEPLRGAGAWWLSIKDMEDEENPNYLEPWQAMIAWFGGRAEFIDTAFVCVGESSLLMALSPDEMPPGTVIAPCVLPRLALGLTRRGSLCGLFGWSVQT